VSVNTRRQYVSGERHPRLAAALAVVVVTGLVVLQRLDATLGAMQRPGDPSATATGLANPWVLRDLKGHFAGVQAWKDWDDQRTYGWDSLDTLRVYVVVDCVLVALMLGSLLLLLNAAAGGPALWVQRGEFVTWVRRLWAKRRRRPGGATEPDAATPPRPPAAWEPRALLFSVPVAAAGYAVFDVLENIALLGTRQAMSEGWLWAVGFLSIGKWVALATAVLPLVAAGLAALARRRARRVRRVGGEQQASLGEELIALRAQLAVVAMLVAVVVLPGELGKQIDDTLLALPGRGRAVFATVLAVVLLCTLMESSGRWCLRAYSVAGRNDPQSTVSALNGWLLSALFLAGAVALTLGIDSIAGDKLLFGAPPLVALTVPGALLVGFVVLSLPARRASVPGWGTRNTSRRVLIWLSVAPLLAVGLVSVRVGVLVLVTEQVGSSLPFLLSGAAAIGIAIGIALVVGTTWWERVRKWARNRDGSPRPEAAVGGHLAVDVTFTLAAAALVVGWRAAASPVTAGAEHGTWAVLFVFLMLLLTVLTLLVILGDWLPVRGIVAAVGFRRVPMIAVVAVCAVVTSMIDTDWRYHDARLVPADPAVDGATVTLQAATSTWLKAGDDDAEVRPLVLIAASGGGIRAAYWTSAVLSCVFSQSTGSEKETEQPAGALPPVPEPDPLADRDPCAVSAGSPLPSEEDVLLASGISGSSVGLVVRRALDDKAPAYTRALADDFLSANMAAYFFRDVPNSIARRLPYEDRAAVLEHAWEEAVARDDGNLGCGLMAASRVEMDDECVVGDEDALRFPLLLLNSAGADDACRITVSTLDLAPPVANPADRRGVDGRDCRSLEGAVRSPRDTPGEPGGRAGLPATRDAHDHTCGPDGSTAQDLPLSAAAHLSARFPYVSPTGRLLSCAVDGDATFALDGGVIDSSAASPLHELWPALLAQIGEWNRDPDRTGPCVVPRLMLLDNGYASFDQREDATRPLEATAPVGAIQAVQGQRAGAARQALALAVEDAQEDMTCLGAADHHAVAHFYPVAHPGPQAPLGWTLSQFSRDDLRRELTTAHNECQLAVVRSWFEPDASKATATVEDGCRPKD
jgi:hypothetical protein